MALWMLPVAGAALGALANRKKPLKGAMIGGLLGAGGAYAAPAMGFGAAPAGAYGAGTFGTAAGYGGAGAATSIPSAGGGILGSLGAYAQPAMQGMQAAQMAGSLFGGEQQQAPQMMPQQVSENQQLQGLLQAGQQGIDATEQEQMKRRLQNQQLIQQILGGGNG